MAILFKFATIYSIGVLALFDLMLWLERKELFHDFKSILLWCLFWPFLLLTDPVGVFVLCGLAVFVFKS